MPPPEPSPTSSSWSSIAASSTPLPSPEPSLERPAPSAAKKDKKNLQCQILNRLADIEKNVENYNTESLAIEREALSMQREGLNTLKMFVEAQTEFNKQMLECFKK